MVYWAVVDPVMRNGNKWMNLSVGTRVMNCRQYNVNVNVYLLLFYILLWYKCLFIAQLHCK